MNKTPIKVPLQEWANQNEPGDEMLYKKGYWNQIIFVRDEITALFSNDSQEYEAIKKTVHVISTHRSKSIQLPVYSVEVKTLGLQFILRYNFHDWKVSVISEKPVGLDCDDLINNKEEISHLYCEGFRREWVYPHHEKNPKQFTVEISGMFELYTFLWHIKQRLS